MYRKIRDEITESISNHLNSVSYDEYDYFVNLVLRNDIVFVIGGYNLTKVKNVSQKNLIGPVTRKGHRL